MGFASSVHFSFSGALLSRKTGLRAAGHLDIDIAQALGANTLSRGAELEVGRVPGALEAQSGMENGQTQRGDANHAGLENHEGGLVVGEGSREAG